MALLAIKGHATRGKEVIEILEMLGGRNTFDSYYGNDVSWCYTIKNGSLEWDYPSDKYKLFTLEQFLKKFPYKVGDKVKIKETGKDVTIEGMSWRNGCEVIYDTCYNNDCVAFYSAEELQPYKEETMKDYLVTEEDYEKTLEVEQEYMNAAERLVDQLAEGTRWKCGEFDAQKMIAMFLKKNISMITEKEGSIIVDIPKTYEECCRVLNICPNGDIVYAGNWVYGGEYLEKHLERIRNFQKLLICRDAYWKIAGEQMGLGKPWEPDYTNDDVKFCICCCSNLVVDGVTYNTTEVLVFPTEEMRDAFKENFKDLIEQCKELL